MGVPFIALGYTFDYIAEGDFKSAGLTLAISTSVAVLLNQRDKIRSLETEVKNLEKRNNLQD